MVGTLSVVGSSAVDCHTCPCLCVVDGINNSIGRKQSLNVKLNGNTSESVVLSSSFVDTSIDNYSNKSNQRVSFKGLVLSRSLRKYRKSNNRRLVVVNELGGQYEDTFSDVKTQILNYFTYKAVKTVLNQLYEMNPTQYRWFYDFVAANKPGDGKRFIRELGKEKHELAERVMVTRLHLYGKWVKKCDHAEIYKEISDENLELMRERLMETVIWPSDDTNTERIG